MTMAALALLPCSSIAYVRSPPCTSPVPSISTLISAYAPPPGFFTPCTATYISIRVGESQRQDGGVSSTRVCARRVGAARGMAPEDEKMTRRSPLDFPLEWDRPRPGRRPDIFPQFSPMKTPLPPPLPTDPPEEDEDDEEKKDEEEEEPDKEPEKPEE